MSEPIQVLVVEEQLRWYQTIVSTIADPISYVDTNYIYRAVNDAYARYAKRPQERIVGLSVAELLGSEAFEDLVKPHLDRCFTGQQVHYQAWFDVPGEPPRFMDVGYYPALDAHGSILGAVVNSRDITGRKRAEEALRRERDLVTQIMETSPVGIVVLDRQGQITFVNAQVEKATGLTRDQIVADQSIRQSSYQDPRWRVIDGSGCPLPTEMLPFPCERVAFAVMRSGQALYGLEQAVELPGQQRATLSMNAAPLLDESGGLDGVVITVEDVTGRRQIEASLREHAERLRVLHEIDQAILAARSAKEIASAALRHLRALVPCMRASVATRITSDGSDQVVVISVDCSSETKLSEGTSFPVETFGEIDMLTQGQVCTFGELSSLSHLSPLLQALQAEGVRSCINVPLIAHGELMGFLNLASERVNAFTPEHVTIARQVADPLAIGIGQARLYEQVQRHAIELEQHVAQRTAELQASETRFRTLFEQAAIGIALVDGQGRVLQSNPALQRMLGYSQEELLGKTLTELVYPPEDGIAAADQRGSKHPNRNLMAGKCERYTADQSIRAEKCYIRQDGRPVWVNQTASLVRATEFVAKDAVAASDPRDGHGSRRSEDRNPRMGGAASAIYAMEDISERKRAQAALLQAEKLAIAGKLAASLTHEISNPLQSVIGCLGLAEETLAEGQDVGQYLQVAIQELRRLARIVSKLRNLHRPSGEETRVHTDVNALLDQVLSLSRKRCQERRVEIVWSGAEDLPLLSLVPDQLQQVFLNLLLNAVDAMPEGGQLQISTTRTDKPAGAQVTFADNGVGIASDVLPRIFDPFYSTKPEGLGLGLPISQDIVRQHGGSIEVESQEGEGTRFTVWLPAWTI